MIYCSCASNNYFLKVELNLSSSSGTHVAGIKTQHQHEAVFRLKNKPACIFSLLSCFRLKPRPHLNGAAGWVSELTASDPNSPQEAAGHPDKHFHFLIKVLTSCPVCFHTPLWFYWLWWFGVHEWDNRTGQGHKLRLLKPINVVR